MITRLNYLSICIIIFNVKMLGISNFVTENEFPFMIAGRNERLILNVTKMLK
jgi:hypothetical protein